MTAYIAKRLLLIFPTLLGILLITFVIVQFLPGGPVERMIAKITGTDVSATARIGGTEGGDFGVSGRTQAGATAESSVTSKYRGAQGLDPAFIKQLEKQFGLDKPAHERFIKLVWDYLRFDFGESYYRNISVIDLILEKMPVSISLGLWLTLLTYGIAVPLGIRKAVRDGTPFDIWTSSVLVIGFAIPSFVLGVMLIVFFAGGSFFDWFPLRGLTSDNWESLSLVGKVFDYLWHLVLPLIAMGIGAFTTLAFLTKNSFLDEITKQYVITARSKGLTEHRVLYGHVFRNAMLIIIAGFPGAFLGAFFGGSLLIETIFSLDGLGLLSFKSLIDRDYPVVLGTLYMFSLLGLIVHLLTDLTYTLVDPRIDFENREV